MGRQRSRRVRRCAVPCAPPARSRRTCAAALRLPPAATTSAVGATHVVARSERLARVARAKPCGRARLPLRGPCNSLRTSRSGAGA
eukprot:10139120-Lingulodinium_polyedra.AAC.1